MPTIEEVRSIEQQIAALRDRRDALLKLCQLLRELHDVLGGIERGMFAHR